MKPIKQLLRPERQRLLPEQFSWVDQALVQQHFIDRCEARSAALYLFLVTVADAQGLSYYGTATLARRLHLSDEQFAAARQQLEPPRVLRRLNSLRGLSHEQVEQVLTRGP